MSFQMLSIAGRALAAQQIALEVTSNNMANATTPGYHAERANLVESVEIPAAGAGPQPGALGQGVTVEQVTRFQNSFLSRAVRNQMGLQGQWQAIDTTQQQVQSLFQEPSPAGLQEAVNQWLSGWSTYAQNPLSSAAQVQVYQEGQSLAQNFNDLTGQLQSIVSNVAGSVQDTLTTIETDAAQLAHLNQEAAAITGAGQAPNAIRDQIGVLLNQLSSMTNITYTVQSNQTVNVYLGGQALVQGDTIPMDSGWHVNSSSIPQLFATNPVSSQSFLSTNLASAGLTITWQGTSMALSPQSGSLKGDLAVIQDIRGYGSSLNQLAQQLANGVSVAIGNSSVATAFFDPTQALSGHLAVNPSVASQMSSSGVFTSSATVAVVNGSLANQDTSALNGVINQYTDLVGQVGVDGQTAHQTASSAKSALTSLQSQLSSAVGVDLNQESANLIQEQQSYSAAAALVQSEQTTIASLMTAVG